MVTYREAHSNTSFVRLGSCVIPESFGSSAVVGACVCVPLGEAILPGAMISGGQTSRARTHIKYLCPDGEVSAFPVPGVLVSRRQHGPHGTALGTSAHTPPGGFSYVAFLTVRCFLSVADKKCRRCQKMHTHVKKGEKLLKLH